jgi:two-component sensor histidine kinase
LQRKLEHRGNNRLAIVQSIGRNSFSGNYSLNEARSIFEARFAAFTRTTRLLATSNYSSVSLDGLLRSELEPFTAQTKIEGQARRVRTRKICHSHCTS